MLFSIVRDVARRGEMRRYRWIGSLSGGQSSGFAGICGLHEARDWRLLAGRTEDICRGLVDDVIVGTAPGPEVVRKLDYISDVLCQTIDAAEFCRHVHSHEVWRQEAHAACIKLGAYVHELNTHNGLYTALCHAMKKKELFGVNEEKLVGEMLRRDFERFGVHLEGHARDEMTRLVAFIQEGGHAYMKNAIDGAKTGEILVDGKDFMNEKKMLGQGRYQSFALESVFRRSGRGFRAPGDTRTCQGLLYHCDFEEIRKAAFNTYQSYPVENKRLGEDLLRARHRVADIMGYGSFASYQLDGFSLGNTPHAVVTFLKSIHESLKVTVAHEINHLGAFKSSLYDQVRQPQLCPWDRDWAIQRTTPPSITKSLQKVHQMFNVHGFLTGMSALLERVMGLRLIIDELPPGESWASDVKKVVLIDVESGEMYGTVYLDLLQRPEKFGGAALFTLRCGRLLDDGSYQLPRVALVANIASDNFLSFGDLETLCHEFGHALHSILSRTQLQHLSGTRGPQDIIEVPSHVFERFASNRDSLSLMARSGSSCSQDIPEDIFIGLKKRREHCAALKLRKTVEMCLMDQYMHGERVQREGFGSLKDIDKYMKEFGLDSYGYSTFPPVRFSHIVGYGGNYYSYLFANCIAAEVWDTAQSDNEDGWPSRSLLHEKMLKTGGAKPAKEYVEDLLGARGDRQLLTVSNADGKDGSFPDCKAYLQYLGILSSDST